MNRLLAALSVVLLLPGVASGDEGRRTFEGLVEVSEVLLDVLVMDEQGEVVTGLGPEDFVVEEEGTAVEVTSVSFYATRYGEVADASDDEVPSSRHFILFFHDQVRFANDGQRLLRQQMEVARQSRRWAETELRPSDWVAVVSYSDGLDVHLDFSQDRDAVFRAVGRAATGKKAASYRSDPRRREWPVLARLPPRGELARQTPHVLDALRVLGEATAFLAGRKNLVLFTTGWEESEGEGSDEMVDAARTALNDHNVAVYPVNVTPAGKVHEESDLLARLAEETGGEYHEDFIGFLSPLADIGEATVGYYLLSYQTEHPAGEIGYREVEVRTLDPSHRVRARTGYRYGI